MGWTESLMGYKNKCLLNVCFSHGGTQSLLAYKVLVWGTPLLLVSYAPAHACILQTLEAARQNSHSAFNQLFGGFNAIIFSTCPWMVTAFIREITFSFWGVRPVDIPSIKRRRVQILVNSPYYKSNSSESSQSNKQIDWAIESLLQKRLSAEVLLPCVGIILDTRQVQQDVVLKSVHWW